MKIYEAVAHALQEESVDTVFGLMGDGNLRLLTYWNDELGQRYYGTRHESAAIAMADGYARVSGRVGVCTVTQGPGVTNSMTALVTARKARTPMLFMVGDVASFQSGWPQDVDHAAFFAAAGVPLVELRDPSTAFRDVVCALRLARETRGPVGLNMPTDVQEQEWQAWDDEPPAAVEPTSAPVDRDLVTAAADLLAGARRPVVIGGRGAVEAGCAADLVSVGDRIGAVLATSLRGKGLFGRHPYGLGVVGGLGSNMAVTLVGEADVVLVVGAGMNDFTTMRGNLVHPRAKVVRIDTDAERAAAADVAIVGDAATVVRALDDELASRGVASDGFRPRAGDALAGFGPEQEFAQVDEPGVVDARSLTIALDGLVPDGRTVVTDAGHFFGYPVAYMGVPDGRAFVCGIDFGSIGLGIGHALGAAVARPDRPTVLFVGDGGMLMSVGDLETMVRYDIPLLVVVLNDAAYGSELQISRIWKLRETMSVFPDTDFVSVARALGARAHTVTSEGDLADLKDELSRVDAPTLLDVKISRTVRAAWLEEAFRH